MPNRGLTLDALATETRERFEVVTADIAALQAAAEAHTERRTDDLRKMIREEVKAELATLMETFASEVKAALDPLAERIGTMEQNATQDAVYREFVRGEMDARAERQASEVAFRRSVNTGLKLIYPSISGILIAVVGSKASATGTIPGSVFWIGIGLMVLSLFGWLVYCLRQAGKDA